MRKNCLTTNHVLFVSSRGTVNACTTKRKKKEMSDKNIDQEVRRLVEEAFPPVKTNWPAVILGFALFGAAMWRLDGWLLLVCLILSALLVIAGKSK